tara:strand:- start:49709 stop:50074 length:366 start_codon:yes stop_codon:yes gene_type:complete
MKFKLSNGKYIGFGVLFLVLISITSCYKKKDTISIIKVLDNNERPVVGVEVRLFYEENAAPTNLIDLKTTTTSDGTATFNFNDFYKEGQGGFAVLDIEIDGENKGVIMVQEMVTNKKTIYI